MDPLEQFIRKNKNELKHKHPDRENLWKKIAMDLPEEQEEKKKEAKVISISYKFLARAAAFLLVCGLASMLLWNTNSQGQELALDPQYIEINTHYAQLVNAQKHKLENSTSLSKEEKDEFMVYIEELEKESEELEKELTKNLNNELVIEAVIKNYRERMRLMEQLLNRVEKINNTENEKNINI